MAKILVMYSNAPPRVGHLARLADLAPHYEVIMVDSDSVALAHAREAEVTLGHRYLRQILPLVSGLRWVQSTAGGPHHLLTEKFLEQRPILTRCPIFARTIAWHAFALFLAAVRGLPEATAAQSAGRWGHSRSFAPLPRQVLVLGLGEIGCEVSELLRRNGIRVIGVARQSSLQRASACDEFVGPDTWRAALPECGACILCLPGTASTTGLFDGAAMDALPPHAVVVNVGRGATLDTGALVERLKAGRLAGAALDVVHPEPLSESDPLWKTPRLIITPKVASFSPGWQDVRERFMEEQLSRYVRNEPLLHRMDLDRALE